MSKLLVLSLLVSDLGHCFRSLSPISSRALVRRFSSEQYPVPLVEISQFKDTLKLSSNQVTKLEELCDVIKYWNERVNLISRKDIESLVPNHILPSLSIHAYRPFQKEETIIDVGTGGGLPGVPMAIANPDSLFTLIDSNSKKMKVVQSIVDSLKLPNVRVVCGRAEEHAGRYDFIMGRAVSALPNFLTWSCHLLDDSPSSSATASSPSQHPLDTSSIKSGLLYLKGGDFSDELMQSGISPEAVRLTAVTNLLPGLSSEKFVLYIPPNEISQFRRRLLEETAAAAALKASKKSKGSPDTKRSGPRKF